MENVFYQFNKLSNIMITFLMSIMLLGCILYTKTKVFKGTEREIRLYGMLMGMNRLDIIIIAIQFIQAITFTYAAIIKQVDVKLYAIMLAITTGFYVLYKIRSIFFESMSLLTQIIAIYLNQTLYQYTIETKENPFVQVLQVILTTFMILYAIYAFLTHLDGVIQQNKNVRRNTSEKT